MPTLETFTPTQIACEFQLSLRTLYRHIAKGKIKHTRIGKVIRVSAEEMTRLRTEGSRLSSS